MKSRKTIGVLLFCAVLSFAQVTAPAPPVELHKQMRYLMGTLVEIKAYAADASPASAAKTDEAISAAFEELKRLDALLSNWRSDSELMRLNASVSDVPVQVSAELFTHLQRALAIAEKTDGGFDPTVGPLVRAWGFLPATRATAGRERVAEAGQRVGWSKVRLDSKSRTVGFDVKGMEIDLGGIAKGYAAQRAVKVLSKHGIRGALVSLGSSSIKVLGRPFERDRENCGGGTISSFRCEGWNIYIRDPRDGAAPVAGVVLRDTEGLATSGTYEKVISGKGGKRSHIINPRTGQAVSGDVSITVLAEDPETADALTKPFFFLRSLHSPEAQKILRRFPKASVMLIARQGESRRMETAGAEPARFISLLSTRNTKRHAAETR